MEDEEDKIRELIWAEYLESASVLDIHRSAIHSNWDNNEYLLTWILDNPHVDKATILIIYWMSCPRYFKQYRNAEECTDFERARYDWFKEIENKYISGYYKANNIAMDPSNDQCGYDWTSEYSEQDIRDEVPAEMYKPLKGIVVESPDEFEEGWPLKYAYKFEKLMEDIE